MPMKTWKKISITSVLFSLSCYVFISRKMIIPESKAWNHVDYVAKLHKCMSDKDNIQKFLPKTVNCSAVFLSNKKEIKKAKFVQQTYHHSILDESYYIKNTKQCSHFLNNHCYWTGPVSEIERKIPLAFAILVYKDIHQVERLLRAIYRPHHYYCISVDKKSPSIFLEAVKAIAACFKNVITISTVDVHWGDATNLLAELNCLKALFQLGMWKYFINITGQEFPLKSMFEIARILNIYNGSNDVIADFENARTRKSWHGKAGPVPYNLRLAKGESHVILNREFVDFTLHSKVSHQLLDYLKSTYIPCEWFYQTLNANPQLNIPGTRKDPPNRIETNFPANVLLYRTSTRYKIWGDYPVPCGGRYLRSICIFGIEDLPRLGASPHLFANKFLASEQQLVYDCLEQRHIARSVASYAEQHLPKAQYYQQLDFVNNHI